MKKIILEKLIYKNYLKTALTSILFIEIVLIIIYFNVNNSMVSKSKGFILDDLKKNVYSLVYNTTSEVEHKFSDIENLVKILQNEHENFFKYYKTIQLENKPKFEYAENGMYYKVNDNGGSSVVMSKMTKITEDVKKKLINSEQFDKNFKTIVNSNNMIVASYFNSYDNFNRYYPFIPKSYNAFPSDIEMKNYNFYYGADLKHNPKKGVVWTDVYLDPAGQGWMLSAIAPIYNNGFLEGVSGIDVTVETIIDKFLNFKLPYKGSSFLLSDKGTVVAMTKEIATIFNVKDYQKYTYSSAKKIKETIYKKDEYNILTHKNKELVSNIKQLLKGLPYSNELKIDENKYLLFSEKIDKTSWHIISLIDEKEIVSEVKKLENYYMNLGYIIIFSIIIFYLIFFIYLYSKAKKFVSVINEPLLRIVSMTKKLGSKKSINKIEKCGIVEIDMLSENFNNLAIQLEHRTEKLVKSETQRVFNEKLANTDALTGVYNRRYLTDFTNKK